MATTDPRRTGVSNVFWSASASPDAGAVPLTRNPVTLAFNPSLAGLQINASLVSSITAGPTVAANDFAEYTTLQGALTKGHLFGGGASGVTNANRLLLAPGSTIRDLFSNGVQLTGSAREDPPSSGLANWWGDSFYEVMTNAPDIAIVCVNQTTPIRWLEVDGVLTSTDSLPFTAPASGNRFSWQRIVFPDSRVRRLRFHADTLRDIRCGATFSIWKPAPLPRMKIVGDSFAANFYGPGGEGLPFQSGADQLMRLANRVSRVLGLAPPIQSTRGGTGFVQDSPVNEFNYLRRIQEETADSSVAIVWLFGTGNDSGFAEATYRANIAGSIAAARTKHPGAAVIVSGVLDGFAGTGISNVLNPILRDETLRNGALWLPVGAAERNDDGYIFGTGRVGATTGNGNADIYLGTGTGDRHWNNAGISYAALRYAQDIRDLFSR